MKKISKSELSTPEFAERARQAALILATHEAAQRAVWARGEFVWHNGKRAEILNHYFLPKKGHGLTIGYEDGRIASVFPLALNR